ncbi:MAG: phosphohistidine phosphatase SixA [Desulfatiglans sp.]|jgi:phosphohistidine phosphatase|nr:phosphohistidine phosphatase SixA [Thermodesulfobacteriota bacterium]MEE4353064.1 phosphohistidine phosphatase SixA [Desulfatiglans sp.]
MALFLVQHGQSLPKDMDPDRSLSKEGKETVSRIASVAAGYGVFVSMIKHSGKARAQQTAELIASFLQPEKGVEETDGLNPMDDVKAFAETIDQREDVMLVGHLPFMERLVSYLITGSVDVSVFKFQNGGIVCLDKDPDKKTWFIKWTLMPQIG